MHRYDSAHTSLAQIWLRLSCSIVLIQNRPLSFDLFATGTALDCSSLFDAFNFRNSAANSHFWVYDLVRIQSNLWKYPFLQIRLPFMRHLSWQRNLRLVLRLFCFSVRQPISSKFPGDVFSLTTATMNRLQTVQPSHRLFVLRVVKITWTLLKLSELMWHAFFLHLHKKYSVEFLFSKRFRGRLRLGKLGMNTDTFKIRRCWFSRQCSYSDAVALR